MVKSKCKVRGIRGAITVEENTAAAIYSATRELLLTIKEKNDFEPEDVAGILFTMTSDLDAAFPARAARELGWTYVPLLCASELDVSGGLEKCIRVMLFVNTEKAPSEINHVYLRGASSLREDL